MAQATRHRHLSFSVQSMRYTGQRFINVANDIDISSIDYTVEGTPYSMGFDPEFFDEDIEKVVYLRPVGFYFDREGNKYEYTQKHRNQDLSLAYLTIQHYANRIDQGFSPEHARGCLVYDFRQDFVVTFNARSLLHFCDLRLPKDAQLEIRTLAQMLFEHFKEWMPSVSEFYEKTRYEKNKLSP
jgi:thymidylate synthase (FAD)